MNTIREARIRRDLNNVASQVESLLSKLGDEGSDRLADLRDRVSSVTSDLAASARDRLSSMDVRGNARQAAKVTTEYVRENPWRVIGIGAAAGLLLGYLATRRRY
ncbi:DUF883 family protein [Ideonella sp. BN130291]|uniref:DUF883 family protein n=1 Tax=Ideonella sp. BN130291 TaxID=3112940 RepID=UPI002E26EDBF|nr:DUF883 domain-containing protein [Ideonella sp. BN130291]